MTHWLPESAIIGSGVGPVIGGGMDWKKITMNARFLWSPPGWQWPSEAPDWQLTAATLTVGLAG